MKRLIFAIAVALTLSSCATSYYTPAPVTGAVNISIQPSWGPAGYDYALYYYFPEFNFYYDVERALFYYQNYGRWVSAKVLPKGRHYPTDLHRYYKVVINERNPWNYNRQHKRIYKHHKGVYTQRNLRDERQGKEAPRRIQTPQHSTPPRNNNTMQGPQSTPNRGQGGVGQAPSNSRPPQGNVGSQGGNTRPSGSGSSQGGNVKPGNGNNSSVRPGSGSSSQGNVRPGGSSSTTRPSGSGSSQGNVRPGSGSNVKPSGNSTPSRGTAKPSGSSSSKGSGSKSSVKSGSSSKSSSSGSRSAGSQSSGARSTGSRGR